MNIWDIVTVVVVTFAAVVLISSLIRRIKEAIWARKIKKQLAELKKELLKAIEESE